MAPAMPCKTSKKSQHWATRGKSNEIKSKFACILEASESTRLRMEESLPNCHEDHIAGNGENSLQHYNLVHKFVLIPQAMKIPAAKAAVDKEWENWPKKIRRGTWRKSEVRKRWSMKQGRRAQKFILPLWWTCHLKIAELETKHHKYKGRVVLRGDIVKDDSGSYAIFTEQRSSAYKRNPQKSWISYPECQDPQDKQLMQYLLKPGKNGRCSKIIENSKNGMSRHLDSSTTTQMAQIMVQYGRSSRSSWAESVRSSFGRTVVGNAIWENPFEGRLGEGFQLGMLIRTPWKRVVLICVRGWQKLAGKKQNIDPMWKVLNEEVDSGEPTSFLDHVYLVCTRRQREISKDNVDNYKTCLNHEFPRGELRNYHALKIFVFLHGPTIWKVMPRNVWNDIVSWQTRRLNNSTSIYSMHWWPSFQRRRIEICRRTVTSIISNCLKCLYLARIGRPDILWSVNKFARSITKWTKACDKRLSRLISYIHHTCEYKQYFYVSNTARQCTLGVFQDSDFAGDLEDSKSTSGGTLCVFGSHTFVPISWMCQKQMSVSHSSTESEIISLDAGLRLDGIAAFDLWDLIVAFLHGNTNQSNQARGDLCTNQLEVRSVPPTHFKNASNLREWSLIWIMLILFPQTSNLLIRKLCCMCLKTTNQWSRWS